MMSIITSIEMNVVAIAILCMLYFSGRQSGVLSFDQYQYSRLLLLVGLVLVLDIASVALDGVPGRAAYVAHVLVNLLYYILHPLICFFWLLYSDYRVYSDEAALRKRLPVYLVPLVIGEALILLSLWTGWIFRIDENNVYSRGPALPLIIHFILPCFLYLFYAGVIAIRRLRYARNADERREYYSIALFMIPPFIGAVVQARFYGVTLLWPCTALSLLLIFLNIQNKQISTDALTGINNRRMFNRYLTTRLSAPEPPANLVLLLIDIDGFKAINDTYGHLMGDAALVHAANLLKGHCTGKRDFLARFGGDEFAIICQREHADDIEKSIRELTRAAKAFNASHVVPYTLTFSIGSASFLQNGIDTESALINAADKSMYLAKMDKQALDG